MLSRLRSLIDGALHRNRFEDEMADELRFHVDAFAADLIRAGVPAEEAARRARVQFGGAERVREECRQARGLRWLDETRQDLSYAVRQLRRAPGFAAVAILTLALGIGATTSIFSVVRAVVLRPLPFPESDRLVAIGENWRGLGRPSDTSAGNFADWRSHARSFTALGALNRSNYNLSDQGDAERVIGGRVTWTWFDVCGVRPLLGRTFLQEEDAPGQTKVTVLSHRLWTRRFGGDRGILGRQIRLNSVPHIVIGVMPAAFDVTANGEELWVPIAFTPQQLTNHDEHDLTAIARLAPGVSIAQANVELKALYQRMTQQYPNDHQITVGVVDALQADMVSLSDAV